MVLFFISTFFTASIKAQDSLFAQNQNGSISAGFGEMLYGEGHRINSNANLSLNVDLKIKKLFYIKIGGDLFEHWSYETSSIVYLGPEIRYSILHRKFDIAIDMGILGLTGFGKDGLGFGASLFLNPSIKYCINNFLVGIELRNYCITGKTNYYLNPLISFSYSY